MSETTRAITSVTSDSAVELEPFLAVTVTHERSRVLRALTEQAVEHFGRDHLFIYQMRVDSTDSGATFLATALFSTVAPSA